MSSNDSTSSSRLSQFGLYRTIDARTEDFLKLSRQRQIRQGCACAAVSTAVTVTVVVSILFLYGYGVSSSSSATLRTPSWLDLMNDSTDTTSFDDKFQNSIKFNRAGMNLLPIFFDKNLDEQESSSQKYETPTEESYKRSVFPGSTNPFLAQAKRPTPGLYSVQYKTYPVLYIQSPRNTEYYMKVRKTREYERIMSYIDKMINEKVSFSSRSMRNFQYPTTTEKNTERPWTVPVVVRKTIPKTTEQQPKEKTKKIILRSNKNCKQLAMPHVKFNNTMIYEDKNCKCRNHFGTLLNKILKCFQELVKNSSEQPCSKKTPNKGAVEIKNQNTGRSTLTTTTASVRPATTTTPFTFTTSTTTLPTTTTTTTTDAQTDNFTSTEIPTEILQFSNSFLQKPALPNDTNIKPKELLSQMSPFYIVTANINNSKNIISKSNTFAPIKPKSNKFLINNFKSKLTKTQKSNEQNDTFSITKQNADKSLFTIPQSTTTTTPEKYEEIFKKLLFPETNDLEYTKLAQKAIKKYDILRSRTLERVPTVIKPHTTTNSPTTSTSYNFKQHQTEKHPKVSTDNIVGKINSRPYAPLQSNKRLFSGLTPEDYIMERIRHESKKQNTHTFQAPEPVTLNGNKQEKSKNFRMLDKIKNLLKFKLMQQRRKTPYNSLSTPILKSKTEPKYVEDKQTDSPQKNYISTEYVAKNNFNTLPTPYASTTTFNRTTKSTARIISVIESSTSPTQLRKYPQDPFLLETTTQPSLKKSNYELPSPKQEQRNYKLPFPKQERRNIAYNSREDIWGENEVYKSELLEIVDTKTATPAPKNNYIPTTTTERVKNDSTGSIVAASVDLGLNKITAINDDEKIVWGSPQTDDNYTPYKDMIPVGRKSYLEISRGDWKQKEQHTEDTNAIYEAFDEIDGL